MDISNIKNDLNKYLDHVNKNDNIEFECVLSNFNFSREDFTKILKYCNDNYELVKSIDRESLDISIVETNERITILNKKNILDHCKLGIVQHDKIIKKQNLNGFKPLKTKYNVYFKIKNEIPIENEENVNNIIKDIKPKQKIYRYKQRYSYLTKKNDWRIDCTIVKSSKKNSTNIINSGVLKSIEKFEVEIEYIKNDMDIERNIKNLKEILDEFLKIINNTKFIINDDQKTLIINNYIRLVNNELYKKKGKDMLNFVKEIKNNPKRFFLSYQPITLETVNLIDNITGVTNILSDYTVTEKADGERGLLYVDDDGKIYVLNSRLNVRYTGTSHKYKKTLIDGELIKIDDDEIFMCFDIYFIDSKDIRSKPLVDDRLNEIKKFIKDYKEQDTFNIKLKEFKYDEDIFKLSEEIYNDDYEYKIDGLIFTPKYLSVGEVHKNSPSKTNTFGGTWSKVFKWKPPSENTIDFLVKFISKDNNTLLVELLVANKINTNKFINPLNVYNEKININNQIVSVEFDKTTIDIVNDHPRTDNNEIIHNNYIVEFYYDKKWKPYRIRYDKTQLYQMSNDILGTANMLKTAMNVWRTIQNPVNEDMLFGHEVITFEEDTDVYYAREVNRYDSLLINMSKYHNKGIKDKLFKLFRNKSYSLIELACGKGGDLFKWISSDFNLVVGVDNSVDNILNQEDGIYSRYNKAISDNIIKLKNLPMIFYQKDLSKKWEDVSYVKDEYMRLLYDVSWGKKKKSELSEDKVILQNFLNVMNDKFNVVSCQFAIHYFFENDEILDIFCDNVDKVIKKGGYFIGTTLDGYMVKEMLKKENKTATYKDGEIVWEDEKITAKINDNLVWMIKNKKVNLENDNIGLGQKISVYLETINREYDEYLVDFNILEDKLEERGIKLLEENELKKMGLTSSSGSFKMFYNEYIKNMNQPMSLIQQEFSNLNKWFIFKKI